MISSRIKTNGLLLNRPGTRFIIINGEDEVEERGNDDEIMYPIMDSSRTLSRDSKDKSIQRGSQTLQRYESTLGMSELAKRAEGQLASLQRFSKKSLSINEQSAMKFDKSLENKKKLDHETVILELLQSERSRLEAKFAAHPHQTAEEAKEIQNQIDLVVEKINEQTNTIENLEFQLLEDQIYLEESQKKTEITPEKVESMENVCEASSDQSRDSLNLFLQYEKLFKDSEDVGQNQFYENASEIKIDHLHEGECRAAPTHPTTATTKLPIMTIKDDFNEGHFGHFGFDERLNTFDPELRMEVQRAYNSDQKVNFHSEDTSSTSTPNHKSWPLKQVNNLAKNNPSKNRECTESSESMLSSNENSSLNQKSNKNSFELDDFDSQRFHIKADHEINRSLMSYYESQCNQIIPEKDIYVQGREQLYPETISYSGKVEIRDRVSRLPHYNNLSIYENQKPCPAYDTQISDLESVLLKNRMTLPMRAIPENSRSCMMKTISATTSPDPIRKVFSVRPQKEEISSERCKRRNPPAVSNDRSRPLTRYLPAPDRDDIDLRDYLETICSYDLNSINTRFHITVQKDRCFGFLSKMTAKSGYKSSLDGLSPSKSPSFLGLAKRKAMNLIQKQWKRRWFLLDRRRRIITYFDNEINLASGISSNKPKALISFADIVNVIPDTESGPNGNTFNMILLSNGTNGDSPTINFKLKAPNHECMQIWQDVLFLCAGAYSLFKKSNNSNNQKTQDINEY